MHNRASGGELLQVTEVACKSTASKAARRRQANFFNHQDSRKGRTSVRNDQAERGWWVTCQTSSAMSDGLMKQSSGLSGNRARVQGRSMIASIIMKDACTPRGPI